MSKYSRAYYESHKEKFRKSSKKYYESHKDEMRVKYAHHRKAWDEAHRAYLNEHARLAKEIREAESRGNVAVTAFIEKRYLRELHEKGIA